MEHDQEVCSTQSAEEIDNALAKDYSKEGEAERST